MDQNHHPYPPTKPVPTMPSPPTSPLSSTPATASSSASALLTRLTSDSQHLLAELSQFQSYLAENKKENAVELRRFKDSVLAEGKGLSKFEGLYRVEGVGVDRAERCVRNGDAGKVVVNGEGETALRSTQKNDLIEHGDDADNDEDEEGREQKARRSLHALRSSNIPFLTTVWDMAKRSHGIKALTKRYFLPATKKVPDPNKRGGAHHPSSDASTAQQDHSRRAQGSVLVDLVSSDGRLWTKISLVTEKRLIYNMAKEGYGITDEDEEDADSGEESRSSSGPDLELIRLATELRTAAKAAPRVNYLHPRVRLILPRLSSDGGGLHQVQSVFKKLQAMSIEVICKDNLPISSSPSDLSSLLPLLSPSPFTLPSIPSDPSTLTSTLNLDCTILLALISDISHLSPSKLPLPPSDRKTLHAAIRNQIAAEASAEASQTRTTLTSPNTPPSPNTHSSPTKSQRLLDAHLWPILSHRTLLTTYPATVRMAEIVRTIGTPTERARVPGFFGPTFDLDNPDTWTPPSQSVHHTQTSYSDEQQLSQQCHALLSSASLSDFPLPSSSSLNLPIRIIAPSPSSSSSPLPLPDYAVQVCALLSPLNASVFLTGWALGVATVTSNRGVAREVVGAVGRALDRQEEQEQEEQGDGGWDWVENGERGPRMWVIGTARSLIGKERGGSGREGED